MSESVFRCVYDDGKVAGEFAVDKGILTNSLIYGQHEFYVPFEKCPKEIRGWIISQLDERKKGLTLRLSSLSTMYDALGIEERLDREHLLKGTVEGNVSFLMHYVDIKKRAKPLEKKREENITKPDLLVIYAMSEEWVKNQITTVKRHINSCKTFKIPYHELPTDMLYTVHKHMDAVRCEDYRLSVGNIQSDKELITKEDQIDFLKKWVRSQEKEADASEQEKGKERWIQEHGSTHLKRAFAKGYHSQREYVIQRGQHEFPAFTVDFDKKESFQERPFPSEKALDEEDKWMSQHPQLEVRVMWDKQHKQEVLVMKNFLDRYTIYCHIPE